jgi:predicted 3-demethylubiquinone-9 3-methyltransferase (glyoxalase superfamily)
MLFVALLLSQNKILMASMQKITTNFWFDQQAEEAVSYYTSVFKNSEVLRTTRYGKEGYDIHHMTDGTVMTVEFQLEGQQFVALNGGPDFKFNEAISLVVNCTTQEEIDFYWEKLTHEGDPKSQQCGWLKDKFGLSWQIVPTQLADMMQDADREKSGRVMKAMLQMKKLDLKKLQQAYQGEGVGV